MLSELPLCRACARSDVCHETRSSGLWFLTQHQHEGHTLVLVRSGFKPHAPGEWIAGPLRSVPTSSPLYLSL